MKNGNAKAKANFFGFGAALFGPPEAFNDDYLYDAAPAAADNNDDDDNADAAYCAACDRAALAAAPAAC